MAVATSAHDQTSNEVVTGTLIYTRNNSFSAFCGYFEAFSTFIRKTVEQNPITPGIFGISRLKSISCLNILKIHSLLKEYCRKTLIFWRFFGRNIGDESVHGNSGITVAPNPINPYMDGIVFSLCGVLFFRTVIRPIQKEKSKKNRNFWAFSFEICSRQ